MAESAATASWTAAAGKGRIKRHLLFYTTTAAVPNLTSTFYVLGPVLRSLTETDDQSATSVNDEWGKPYISLTGERAVGIDLVVLQAGVEERAWLAANRGGYLYNVKVCTPQDTTATSATWDIITYPKVQVSGSLGSDGEAKTLNIRLNSVASSADPDADPVSYSTALLADVQLLDSTGGFGA